MRMNLDRVASAHFVLGRDILCEFDYWLLAVSIASFPGPARSSLAVRNSRRGPPFQICEHSLVLREPGYKAKESL